MSDLIDFLRARLADAERLINAYEAYMTERAQAAGSYVLVQPPGWQAGEPFDTARMLREVEAARQIIDDCELFDHGGTSGGDLARLVLLALARSYSDDPDFPPGYTEMRETP